jgi:hypothetical protein
MRRPGLNKKQRAYAKESRALLSLRRAAVRFTTAIDLEDHIASGFHETTLQEAAMKYANALPARERRRLAK